MRVKPLFFILCLALLFPAMSLSAGAEGAEELSVHDAAGLICEAAVYEGERAGVPVVVWVLDMAGRPVMMRSMARALPAAIEAAYNKAWTSVALHAQSGDLPGLIEQGDLAGLVQDERILPFGGGIPIHDGRGVQLGAIGVAGGSPEQDREIAQAALKAMDKGLNFS